MLATKGLERSSSPEAFGQDVDGGEVVFAELVGKGAEPPAKHHHVSGGEGEHEFLGCLRTATIVVLGVRVWFEGVIHQLAGREAASLVFGQVKLDAGAILAGGGVAIFFGEHRRYVRMPPERRCCCRL